MLQFFTEQTGETKPTQLHESLCPLPTPKEGSLSLFPRTGPKKTSQPTQQGAAERDNSKTDRGGSSDPQNHDDVHQDGDGGCGGGRSDGRDSGRRAAVRLAFVL
jgi:hypothetical protein